MFHHVGRLAAGRPWSVCLIWLAAGAILSLLAPPWDAHAHDDDVRYIPDRFTSVRAHKLLEAAFPQDVFASKVALVLERPQGTLTAEDFRLVDRIQQALESLRGQRPDLKLGRVETYRDGIAGARLTSGDRQCTLICLSLGTPYLAVATQNAVNEAEAVARRVFAEHDQADGADLFVTGAAGIGRDLTVVAGDSLDSTTWATILLVVVVLLLVYRAPLLALVPLASIAVSAWVSLKILALATLIPGVYLVNISKLFAIVILYGAGTDYCLFLISRYREELQNGHGTDAALERSVGGVGEALAASAGTIMVGLGLMGLAEFAKVRYSGPAIALSLFIALLASLTLTPALLKLGGRGVFWPARAPGPETRPMILRRWKHSGFWEWISHVVVARPGLTWCVATVALLPLILLGMQVEPSYRATGELSPETESLKGLAAIQRHYNPGEVGPVTVLLAASEDWSGRQGIQEIDFLSRSLANLPGVAEVRSLTQPIGLPPLEFWVDPDGEGLVHRLLSAAAPFLRDLQDGMHDLARKHYVARTPDADGAPGRFVTRLDVVLQTDPFEPESTDTLRSIRGLLDGSLPRVRYVEAEVQAECHGVTAGAQDLASVTESDRWRVNTLVLGAIYLILLVLVRKWWLALYLLVTVLASYYAALGATVLAGTLWTGAPLPHLDWRVPFFLFIILVAVGEDYNILLISRAVEERRRFGPIEGVRRALSRTGGAITSCGLIMAGTFATLMLAGLNTMMQVGFALAFGVLIDTFIVRPFLVPAFAVMFWKGRAAPGTESAEPSSFRKQMLEQDQEIDRAIADFKKAA